MECWSGQLGGRLRRRRKRLGEWRCWGWRGRVGGRWRRGWRWRRFWWRWRRFWRRWRRFLIADREEPDVRGTPCPDRRGWCADWMRQPGCSSLVACSVCGEERLLLHDVPAP